VIRPPAAKPTGRAVRAGLLLLGLTGGLACRAPAPPPRDFYLLSVDTLRADHLGFSGYTAARTPHLDRLAASGTRFDQAITPMPRTTPALGSMLTGVAPHRHGSREVGDPLVRGTMLAEILRERGYSTLAVSANLAATPKQGFDRGFERFVSWTDLTEKYAGRLYRDLTDVPPTGVGWATVVTDEALALVAEAPSDRPLFLWLFYFDPHFLYRPPSPWQEGVEAARCYALYDWVLAAPEERKGWVYNDVDGVASAALDDCRRLYDAEIAYTDAEIGRLLERLAAIRPGREPVVLFTADHGENLGEEGLYFEHGENLHESSLRVPFVWSGPGIAAGRRDGDAATLLDVVPTALSLLDLAAATPPDLDGVDLTSRLLANRGDRPGASRRILFAESANALTNEAFGHLQTGRAGGRVCVNDERFALCEETSAAPGRFTLHDHRRDPGLVRDLAAKKPRVVEKLRAVRERWPPESARILAARTRRYKLVARPRSDGAYDYALYDLEKEGEGVDVTGRERAIFEALRRELDGWASGIDREGRPPRDRELEEDLRSLGYIG
jgi:arylsulfatase A-like enzyme